METYLLSIFVTLEQEIAVRHLFIDKGWDFKKYEDPDFSEYSDVKVEPSRSVCQDLYTPEPVRPEWTAQAGTDDYTDVNDNDLFECDGEKSPILTFQSNTGSLSKIGDSVSGSTDSNTNEATENDVIIKLAEIMEDSLRNMPEGVFIGEDKSVIKQGSGELLEKASGELSIKDDEPVQARDHCLLKDPLTDDKSQYSSRRNYSIETKEKHSRKRCKIKENSACTTNSSFDCNQKLNSKDCKKASIKKESVNANKRLSLVTDKGKTGKDKSKKTGSFHCVDCNYTFKLLGAFKKHKKNGKCIFECEYCGKRFTARYFSNYTAHLKYHLKDRPYKCSLCDKSYIDAQALKIHIRTHTGERPFQCDICGKSFYSSSHLVYHKNTNHLNVKGVFKCEICSAVLSTMGNLRVHLKVVHTSERPFTCEICGKTFKTQKSLEQIHAKVHQNTYPYKCEVTDCGKVFKRSESLADHMRRHNNERSHFCERCGKGFYCNKDLQLHLRTHSGIKPYSCHLCQYKCALAGNLRKHMKTHQ